MPNVTKKLSVQDKANVLAEALPYIQQFAGESFVLKFGGSAMGDPELFEQFARDVVLLKHVGINPIIVHGGGPQIGHMLDKLNIGTEFVDGLRVTDKDTVEVVEMVLAGNINKQIVSAINRAGGMAVGLSGKDAHLIEVQKLKRRKKDVDSNIEKIVDLGFVGEPSEVNPEILMLFEESDIIPVIAPIGVDSKGDTYNINADTAAGAIAASLAARKLIMLTDVEGVLDKNQQLISRVKLEDVSKLIKNKTISGGMIPKMETCVAALGAGVEAAHILDGRAAHSVLLEIFTEGGTGTMVY